MERILSPDERIARAEEIYYRKRIQAGNRDSARVNVSEKRSYYLLKKMFLQIAICIFLYCILYLIQTTDYVFSADVLNKTKEILSYDIDFKYVYDKTNEYFKGFVPGTENVEEPVNENVVEEKQNENITNENTTPLVNEAVDGTGGLEVDISDEEKYLTQMEKDAKSIKDANIMKIPLKGTITSRFGNRNPTTASVPRYHTGIDIAVNSGTVFVSGMSGTVELVSSEGDYRKSCEDSKQRCYDCICPC